MKKKFLVASGYIIFALTAATAMLLWKFPYENFNSWLLSKINTPQGPIQLQVGTATPSYLPPGLFLKDVKLTSVDLRKAVDLPTLKLSLPLIDLLATHPGVKASGAVFGGNFSGSLAFNSFDDPDTFFLRLKGNGLDLSTMPLPENRLNAEFSGLLQCNMHLEGRPQPLAVKTGTGSLTLKDAVIKAPMPYLKGGRIPLGGVEIDFDVSEGRINVRNCRFNSPKIKGELSGSIYPGRTLADTSVDLKGTYRIDPLLIDTQQFHNTGIVNLLQKIQKLPLSVKGKLSALYVGFF